MYIWGDHFTHTDNDFDTKNLIRGYEYAFTNFVRA